MKNKSFRELSDLDRDLLLKVLKNPPEPNEALKDAADRVFKMVIVADGGEIIYDLSKN